MASAPRARWIVLASGSRLSGGPPAEREPEVFDGFYGLATSLDVDDVPGILKVAAGRWEIEECFRIMKHEMKARPVYLSREDRIRAHFLARFVALLACRIVEKRLGGAFTCPQVIDALRSMQMERVRGDGGNRDSNCQRRDFTLKPRSSTEEVGAGQKYYLHNFG